MEDLKKLPSSHSIGGTVSLLSQRCVDLLDLAVPGWQATPLKTDKTELSEIWQTLHTCKIKKVGDLTTLTPLTLLALAAKADCPPTDVESFWLYLLHCVHEQIRPLLKPLLIELVTNFILQGCSHTHKQSSPDTGFSSLFIQPQEVIDQVSYPDAITILNWPFIGTRPVAFAESEIRSTPLLARHIQDALYGLGCDLSTIPLTALPLSIRTANIFVRSGDTTLKKLVHQTPESLFAHRNFGNHAYEEVAGALREYLAPWLAQLPPDTLVPTERRNVFVAVKEEDKAPIPLPELRHTVRVQQSNVPSVGKNALFFSVDSVLQALRRATKEVSETEAFPIISPEEAKGNKLLSHQFVAVLAAKDCDLMRISLQDLAFREGDDRKSLSRRTYNALVRARVDSLGDLISQTPAELMSIRNFGAGCYREVVECLQAYLQPWLDELGVNPVTGAGLSKYEDAPPAEQEAMTFTEPVGILLSDAFSGFLKSDLFALLDLYDIRWQEMLVSEACDDMKLGSLPSDLALGDLSETARMSRAEVPVAPEVADQVIACIQQALIIALVDNVLQTELSEPEQLNYQQELANVSIESVLAELIHLYIFFKYKDSARASSDLPREMKVMLAHAGVIDGQRKTFVELGTMLGLTRARVQQLEERAEEFLQERQLRPFVEGMSVLVKWAIRVAGGVTTVSLAAKIIEGWLPFGLLHPVAMTKLFVSWTSNVSVKGDARLVTSSLDSILLNEIEEHLGHVLQRYPGGTTFDRLVDEVILAGGEQLFTAGREFVSATIRTSDLIEPQGDYCWPKGKGTLKTQLASVFRNLGRPAHFSEVAERYQNFFPAEKQRSAHAVHSLLLRYPEVFVRVGDGTYALAENGYKAAPTVFETIEHYLEESERPLHATEVISLAKEHYDWTENTLRGCLQADPKIKSLGNSFFGLADRDYRGFDMAKTYADLFGAEPVSKERLVIATFTNQDHHPVVQLRLSGHTITTGTIALTSKPLREMLPFEGVFKAEGIWLAQPAWKLAIKRGNHDLSGLGRWFKHIQAQQGDLLFIEKLTDIPEEADYTYRLAYAPHNKIDETMQMVGLSPAKGEAGGAFDYRILRHTREPEKISACLAFTLAHSWTESSAVNGTLGFAPGSPHGAEYLELGLLGGLLALGNVEGLPLQEIVRPTTLGRAWWARQRDTDTGARSFLLTLPPYRAHLRKKGEPAVLQKNSPPEQNGSALLDPGLTAIWDDRLGLISGVESGAVLSEAGALIATSRLPGPVLTMLLLLLMAQSNGLGISLPMVEASGLADAVEVARRLRQLGVNVIFDAGGSAALSEQVNLAVISSASVEERLRAQSEPMATALGSVWATIQQRVWPTHTCKASDFYAEGMDAHGTLFHSLLTPTPEIADQAARFMDGQLFPCPFMGLATDWGLLPANQASAPFAFLSHADQRIRGRPGAPVAICLNHELIAQPWDPRHALAANAHLALLILAASDLGGLADCFSHKDKGYLFNGQPLISWLDALLRGMKYEVWDEAYCQDTAAQGALGQELVALGERLDLLKPTGARLEADASLAREVYYSAYDVLLYAQSLVREGAA